MIQFRARLRPYLFPLLALLACLLAYGLLTPWLGFYFDDWPVITTLHTRSVNTFWDFYFGERPFSAWTYILAGPILGTRPLVWQMYSILVRWLTVLGMWWSLKGLWPQRQREAAWIALLFAVFPAFDQQAISVAYSQHWMIYALYCASIGAMIQSIRKPRSYWPWTAAGVLACAVHTFSMEYFIGLELLRPMMLWIIAADTLTGFKARLRYCLRKWLPYLAVLVIFVLWRLLVLPTEGLDPNTPHLLYDLFSRPLATVVSLTQFAVQDFINILYGAWYKTLDPNVFVLTDRTVLFSILVGIIGAALAFYGLSRLRQGADDRPAPSSQGAWLAQAFTLGVAGVILGTLPVWLTDRQTTLGLYGSRFALAGTFGASILTIAALEWLTVRRTARVVLLSVLIGLAIAFHVRRANDFRWSWTKQTRFYWQLYWRAPDLKPGTLIGSDGEFFPYVGRYATSLALNLLYPASLPYPQVAHWFYESTPELIRHPEEMVQGKPLEYIFRNFRFTGSTVDTVVVYYAPESGKCLWVLSPQDGDNPELPSLSIGLLPLSNLDLIEPERQAAELPPTDIFGPEPPHDWCYYFQKADLARQLGDWPRVVRLGDEAQKLGYSPNNPQEWIPFIEGYARTGRWQEAIQRTEQVHRINFRLDPRLCNLWDHLLDSGPPPAQYADEFQKMQSRLECESAP
jgi:hypothetical protein